MSHVLIVGGTKGIGRVIAQKFEAAGNVVSAFGRDRQQGSITTAINQHGNLAHLIFCQRYRGVGDTWMGEIDVSLSLTKDLIEICSDRFDGDNNSIVIMSSIIAHSVASEQPCSYHMAKSALEGMVAYYGVKLGKKVRVVGVSPGIVLKPENDQYYRDNPAKVALFNRINPLGRMVTAQEVANVVAFLCSPAASAINATVITVDGGISKVNQEALARSFLTNPPESVK